MQIWLVSKVLRITIAVSYIIGDSHKLFSELHAKNTDSVFKKK